jgi:hypothetical protein
MFLSLLPNSTLWDSTWSWYSAEIQDSESDGTSAGDGPGSREAASAAFEVPSIWLDPPRKYVGMPKSKANDLGNFEAGPRQCRASTQLSLWAKPWQAENGRCASRVSDRWYVADQR